MKQSEMLKIIEKGIDNACGNDGENILYPPHDYLAYVILKRIVEAGMIPPIEPGRTVHDLDLGVPEWEPEDEEK